MFRIPGRISFLMSLVSFVLIVPSVGMAVGPLGGMTSARATGSAPTPVPWPTVVPEHARQVRTVLDRFSGAVVHGRDKRARRYLAPGFHGRCGFGTQASQSMLAILCDIPRPLGYRVFSIENDDRAGTALLAVIRYRLPNSRMQPLEFVLRDISRDWRIAWIGLPQG